MEIRTDIKNNEGLRNSFFDLAGDVFGLDLKTWYANGFWQDDYIPYSVVEDGRVVANVSVNICNFRWRTRIRHLAQLGIYLYCMTDKIPFYEKFGFSRRYEWRCVKEVNITTPADIENVPMRTQDDWDRMVDIIQRRYQYGDRIMMNNPGLFMFCLAGPMSDNVFFVPSSEAYVIALAEKEVLTIYAVFSEGKIGLGDVISSFGSGIRKVVTG